MSLTPTIDRAGQQALVASAKSRACEVEHQPVSPVVGEGGARNAFPLTATCHWNSGRIYSFVPAFVNPVIYACIAITLVCAAMVIRDHRRNGHTT
ncbi:hypothetical protein ABZ883_21070 [Streptomyces sp. NPDC046977]|uniref:hypothetical protein n=1 Tax=Streptomyces sp. NPDC046977 TaxID=3154703 RepID=UPI0033E911E5